MPNDKDYAGDSAAYMETHHIRGKQKTYSFADIKGTYTPNAHDVICKDCMGQLASDVTGKFWHTYSTPCTERGVYRAHNIKFIPTTVFV